MVFVCTEPDYNSIWAVNSCYFVEALQNVAADHTCKGIIYNPLSAFTVYVNCSLSLTQPLPAAGKFRASQYTKLQSNTMKACTVSQHTINCPRSQSSLVIFVQSGVWLLRAARANPLQTAGHTSMLT